MRDLKVNCAEYTGDYMMAWADSPTQKFSFSMFAEDHEIILTPAKARRLAAWLMEAANYIDFPNSTTVPEEI